MQAVYDDFCYEDFIKLQVTDCLDVVLLIYSSVYFSIFIYLFSQEFYPVFILFYSLHRCFNHICGKQWLLSSLFQINT